MAQSLEVEEVRERLRWDTPYWSAHCATILNARRQPQRLTPRPWQARTADTPAHITPLDEALEAQRAAGRPMRVVILKARKLGFSTWVQAKFMQRLTQLPYQYALSIAHLRSSASQLMDMARLMYENIPTEEALGLGFTIRPQIINEGQTRQGTRWMVLGDKRRPTAASVIETMTAGSKGGGRASTPSMIHLSEAAHYEDPEFITGALSALPMEPETIAVIESTANGFNDFHTIWANAVEGAEDELTGTMWMPLFYGWQDNPYNALPFISDEARERFERTIGDTDGGGDEEEPWLIGEFGVTLEQLNWRRQIIYGPECRGKLERFHQEHPATPEQAFVGSGSPVFSAILVSKAIKAAETAPAPVEGVLRGMEWRERRTRSGSVRVPQSVLWVPRDQADERDRDLWGFDQRLHVWEHPLNEDTQRELADDKRKPDGQYVVFVDVAQGVGGTLEERDYSAIQVLDHVTRRQVARWRDRIDLHDLPLVVLMVALYFNEAWLAVEKTGLGIGVVDALSKDYRYRRMYRTRRSGDDDRSDAPGHLVGWSTDTRTKPLMEMTFGTVLGDGTHGLRDVVTGREFTTYVEDPKNRAKHGAQKGSHDDLAMAFMGVHRVAAELRPRDPGKKPRRSVRGRTVEDPLTGY